MGRRRFLTHFLFSILIASAGISCVLAQEPIKIGFVHVFSGGMRTFGEVAWQGAQLAVDEINLAGGINGRDVLLLKGDTQVKPEVGKEVVRNLVSNERVDIVIGLVSSAVALAVTPMMSELRCPLIITHAMAHEVTGSICNPWTFRMTWNLDQCFKATALLARELGPTTWTSVGPDYGFGQDSWKYFTKYLNQLGSHRFEDPLFTPMSTTDWKPVIQRLVASGADGIMISLWGKNLQDFVQQAHGMKFFDGRKVICSVGGSVEIFVALGFLHMPKDVWFGSPYWFEAYDNPHNERFVASYQTMSYSNIPPSYAAYNAYAAVKMFKAAVEKAGSSDREAVAKELSGLTVTELPVGPTTFRAEDHQAVFNVAFGMTSPRPAKGSKILRGLAPIKSFEGTQVTPGVSEGECKMRPRGPSEETPKTERPRSGSESGK